MLRSAARWDYSALARHYDKRADYAGSAIQAMLDLVQPDPVRPIADIGAGTGKLTRCLLDSGYRVCAVEPDEAMRAIGIANTAGREVTWSVGTGEETGLPDTAFDLVTFGSSFNVTDRPRALREASRILVRQGWFACLWNHRELGDEIQARCEQIIHRHLPGFDYGTRREDQRAVIMASGLFEAPQVIEGRTTHHVSVEDFVDAWRSHATLRRQAGEAFEKILEDIRQALTAQSQLSVPFVTRIWCARRADSIPGRRG